MATDPPNTPPPAPPAPTSPPGPGAYRDEWRAWRHQQRDSTNGPWPGGWYGPWAWGGGRFWGAALVLIGAYLLLHKLGLLSWLSGDVLWPSLLILLGVVMLIQRGRGRWR